MSVCTQDIVVERIKSATPFSRIAVFAIPAHDEAGRPKFNAIFADTIGGQERIRRSNAFVGIFYGPVGVKTFLSIVGSPALAA